MDPPFLPAVASFCRSLHLGGLISHVATSCVGLHRGCNHQPGLIVRLSRTTFPPNKQFFISRYYSGACIYFCRLFDVFAAFNTYMPIPPSSILTSPAPDDIHQHTAMFFVIGRAS